jgi:hypothetical protein
MLTALSAAFKTANSKAATCYIKRTNDTGSSCKELHAGANAFKITAIGHVASLAILQTQAAIIVRMSILVHARCVFVFMFIKPRTDIKPQRPIILGLGHRR